MAAFGLLTGCVGLDVPSATKPNFVLNEDGPTHFGKKPPKASSLIASFSNSYNLAQCKAQLANSGDKAYFEYIVVNASGKSTAEKLKCSDQSAVSASASAAKMYDDGLAVADAVCRAYFRRLGNQNQDLDYYASMSNNFGGFVAAVLGAAESSAKSISITSASFAALTAGFETFDEAYHFNPDVQAVEDMVFRAKNAFVQEYGTVTNFKQATTGVEGYQAICQTSHIQKLVNEAIASAELTAAPRTAREVLNPTTVSNAELGNLATQLGSPNRISPGALAWLAAFSRGKVATTADRARFDLLLGSEGITLDATKISNLEQWLDNLRATEVSAYNALIQRASSLNTDDLPAMSSTPAEQSQALANAAIEEEENRNVPVTRVVRD